MKEYWKKKDGTYIDIDEMSVNHLQNTLKMIAKNSHTLSELNGLKKVKSVKRFFGQNCEIEEMTLEQLRNTLKMVVRGINKTNNSNNNCNCDVFHVCSKCSTWLGVNDYKD